MMDFYNQKGEDPTARQYVESLLPAHYQVKETCTGVITCQSGIGIEDYEDWQRFFDAIKKYFGTAFKEVYQWTCTYHISFTVYYSFAKYLEVHEKIAKIKEQP